MFIYSLEIYVLVLIDVYFWHLLRAPVSQDFPLLPISILTLSRYNRLFSLSCGWKGRLKNGLGKESRQTACMLGLRSREERDCRGQHVLTQLPACCPAGCSQTLSEASVGTAIEDCSSEFHRIAEPQGLEGTSGYHPAQRLAKADPYSRLHRKVSKLVLRTSREENSTWTAVLSVVTLTVKKLFNLEEFVL